MAWWVVLGHIANSLGIFFNSSANPFIRALTMTSVPVDVFIALSGFAIANLLSKEQKNYWLYVAGRACRLYPIYFAALLISIAIHYYNIAEPNNYLFKLPQSDRLDSINQNYGIHLFLHFLLIHGLVPDQVLPHAGDAIIAPAWSLSLEWQFYLVAPFLFFIMGQKHRRLFTISVFSIITLGAALNFSGITFSYGAFLAIKFHYFIIGIAAYRLFKNRLEINLATILGLCFLTGIALSPNRKAEIASFIVCSGLFVAIMPEKFFKFEYANLAQKFLAPIRKILEKNLLLYFGKMSYSTYLFHGFALLISKNLTTSISDHTIFTLAFVSGTISLTALFSLVAYKTIEEPSIHYGRKLRGRKQASELS